MASQNGTKVNGSIKHDAVGLKCEFKAYHEIVKAGQNSVEPLIDPFGKLSVRDDDSEYALVIRKIAQDDKPDATILRVNSPRLLKVFRDTIKSYTTVPSDFTSPLELRSPFQMLSHYWEELDQRRKAADDAEERKHLDLLFEFMERELKPDRDAAMAMMQKNNITFQYAWFMYRPGDVIYTESAGEPWFVVCLKTAYEVDNDKGPYFEVHYTYTGHNGKFAGEVTDIATIYQKETFSAENPAIITELQVYPKEFVKAKEGLEHRLKVRGERFLKFNDHTVAAYDGHAEFLKEPPFGFFVPKTCSWGGVWLPYTETGRVVLDRKTFGEEQPLAHARVRPGDANPLFCPPFTMGYSLGKKTWCRLFVDNLQELNWDETAWDSLVIGEKEKLVLRSLVTSHQYSDKVRDQLQQKGKGLVVLLHGTPGSGKTLTAETAAEGTKRALISTSVGELNKNNFPASFELELKRTLQYATIWRAIVLLDEADVFLESRSIDSKGDRNVLVAVFLKELEYFGGIVFLTTNRVEAFDVAMKSRIHLSLTYSPPELETRRRIWLQCLRAIPAADSSINPDESVDYLTTTKLNGREIYNAVNTARTIARFQGKALGIDHIDVVLEVRNNFDRGNNMQS